MNTASSDDLTNSFLSQIWDCVVIGAGPSGCAFAISAVSAGVSVLLIDKSNFPRDKVCGCCLNERSVYFLNKLGVLNRLYEYSPN